MFGFNKKTGESQKNTQSQVEENQEIKLESQPSSQGSDWFTRLRKGLNRTRTGLAKGLENLFLGKKVIDDAQKLNFVHVSQGANRTNHFVSSITRGHAGHFTAGSTTTYTS